MKRIAKILLLTVILTSCFSFFGCANLFRPKWRKLTTSFYMTIDTKKGDDGLDFEIANTYDLEIRPFGEDANPELFSVEYNGENMAVSEPYATSRSKVLKCRIYVYEFSQDDTLKITYNGKTVEINYDVNDFDFESAQWITPTSINDLDPYSEFKEMLFSIKYHEFKAPYKGLNIHLYNEYRDEGDWDYNLKDKNDVAYLEYLIDSVYYPSTFDLVEENPVASRYVRMSYTGKYKVLEGSDRSEMNQFYVGYGVIDPCCTNPQYPLRSMCFFAENRKLNKYIMNGDTTEYPTSITVLLEKYPERFFEYDLNGLKIHILIQGNENKSVEAYFTDETYFYSLYSNYVYE